MYNCDVNKICSAFLSINFEFQINYEVPSVFLYVYMELLYIIVNVGID